MKLEYFYSAKEIEMAGGLDNIKQAERQLDAIKNTSKLTNHLGANQIELPDDTFDKLWNSDFQKVECNITEPYKGHQEIRVGSTTFIRAKKETK